MSSLDIIMGVTYKLREEVVRFIISQRQNNPLFSCRQLAESVSQQFGIRLSKSSVHDVLKESGAVTPRGRKPKDRFQIPIEKKKQIQVSLSQVRLVNPPKTKDPTGVNMSNATTGALSKEMASASLEGEAISERTTNFVEIAASLKNTPRNDTLKGATPLQK